MTDLEAEIPQHVEDELHHALAPRRLLVRAQEQEIDVGTGRQRAAAVAADGDDAHALGRGGVGDGVDVVDGETVDGLHDRVLEVGEPARAWRALAVGHEAPLGIGVPVGQRLLRQSTMAARAASRQRRPRLAGERDQPVAQSLTVRGHVGRGCGLVHGGRRDHGNRGGGP